MKEDLRIYAKGLAFTGGSYSLRSLDVLISNHRKILDQLIAVRFCNRFRYFLAFLLPRR